MVELPNFMKEHQELFIKILFELLEMRECDNAVFEYLVMHIFLSIFICKIVGTK